MNCHPEVKRRSAATKRSRRICFGQTKSRSFAALRMTNITHRDREEAGQLAIKAHAIGR